MTHISALEPIEHQMMHERIYTVLQRHIMMGKFSPGERLPLRKLAHELGTSLMPVRDALQRLESIGALVQTPTRTMMVPTLDEKEKADIAHIRSILEAEGAAKAALYRNNRELEELAAHCDAIRHSAAVDDLNEFLEANYNFHMVIAHASRISFLPATLEPLWLRMGPIVRVNMPDHEHFSKAVAFHDRIFAAIAAGDMEAAREAMREDVMTSNQLTS
ncbi:GntR family transcriptional regulator [Gemmobacter fulvus]|uniref:GntR family transcriptional regulator n=1 Tax=Gemmobacter fulvus TaxID=2840474 RepID=UPI002796A73F|nr:GntR family transcriptional regulator [Gemmobacter fulvus]MDQ1850614.1 GntR family transcriptional regulator [Gemmobacter fulvus]